MSDVEKQYEGADPHAPHSTKSDEIERQLGEVDPVYEAKLVRKLDAFIIPTVMLLYLLSFLDRQVSFQSRSSGFFIQKSRASTLEDFDWNKLQPTRQAS